MHHELLFALLGHAGDVIEARPEGFAVREDVPFLDSPQKATLRPLLQLGHAFATLSRFVADQSVPGPARLPSAYVHGLAQGLERVLGDYTKAVVALEHKLLATRSAFPIPQMLVALDLYVELLPELCDLVARLQQLVRRPPATHRRLGAAVLELVHQRSRTGFPRRRQCLQQLQHHCHRYDVGSAATDDEDGRDDALSDTRSDCMALGRILFKQIVSWMLHGQVVDPHGEFFIEDRAPTLTPPTARTAATCNAEIWQSRFALALEAVPVTYFPLSVAESILFVGKAIGILATTARGFGADEARDLIEAMAAVTAASEFSALALEHAVEGIRRHVAARLYHEVVVRADFGRHLARLQSVFLLSRGELFLAFLERAEGLMGTKPTPKSEDDLQYAVWAHLCRDFDDQEEEDDDDVDDDGGRGGGGSGRGPWLRRFAPTLPLQALAFPHFASTAGLALAHCARDHTSGRALVATAPAEPASTTAAAAWWQHPQLDHLAFVSEFVVELETPMSPAPRAVALVLTPDPAFAAPGTTRDSGFRPRTSRPWAVIEVAVRPAPANPGELLVAARVTKGRGTNTTMDEGQWGQDSAERSLVLGGHGEDRSVHCYVQYAQVETRDPASGRLSFHRGLVVVVNDTVLLDTRFDIAKALGLSASAIASEHYVGVAWTPGLRLRRWSVDKFPASATVPPGRSIKEVAPSLSARELWGYLSMRCDLAWPIQLLVSPELLQAYGHLFRFVFRLKRVAHAVERTWKSPALRRPRPADTAAVAAACALRGRMGFVLRHVEQYFQVFVVEAAFRACATELATARDFDDVRRLHEQLVGRLVKGLYLHSRALSGALDDLVRGIWDFVDYVRRRDAHVESRERDGEDDAGWSMDRVEACAEQFDERFRRYFAMLQSVDLRDLVLLLDFNEHFSSETRGGG